MPVVSNTTRLIIAVGAIVVMFLTGSADKASRTAAEQGARTRRREPTMSTAHGPSPGPRGRARSPPGEAFTANSSS
jgi:hypothetical protein